MVPNACAGAFCLPPRGAGPSMRRCARWDRQRRDDGSRRERNLALRGWTCDHAIVRWRIAERQPYVLKATLLGAKRGHWADRKRTSCRDDGGERTDHHEHDGDRCVHGRVVRRLLEQRAPELRRDRRGNREPNR